MLWTNPGDGSGVGQIIPAVPSAGGVADIFALQNDGTVQAIASDGTVAWTVNIGANSQVLADFQGGLVVGDASGDIYKLDGITGQAGPAYAPPIQTYTYGLLAHTDGTVFAFVENQNVNPITISVVGIDPATGAAKFVVPIALSPVSPSISPDLFVNNAVGEAIVAGDGYLYVPYATRYPQVAPLLIHTYVLRVNSQGASDVIPIQDWTTTFNDTELSLFDSQGVISNADQGIVMSMQTDTSHTVTTNGTSASMVSGPLISNQAGPVAPVLQVEDGSFVGTALDISGNQFMVAFAASGNVKWSVANETPQAAIRGGGVVAGSGTTYDQNGSASGQVPVLTQSWTINSYSLSALGVLQQVAATPLDIAFSYGAVSLGNPSLNLAFIKPHGSPQEALYLVANADLMAAPQCAAALNIFAGIASVSTSTLVSQIKATANAARSYVYDGPSASSVVLDALKFPGAASPEVNTVSGWFAEFSDSANYADALSQYKWERHLFPYR